MGGHARCRRLEEHRRKPVSQGKDAKELGEGQRVRPSRSVRNLRRQKRIRGRGSAVLSGRQHGDGLEELEPTHRNDAATAPRRRFGLATMVPFDAG